MLFGTVDAKYLSLAAKVLKDLFKCVNVTFTTNTSNHIRYFLGIKSNAITTNSGSSDHLIGILLSYLISTRKTPVFEVIYQIFIRIDRFCR